MFVCVCVCVCVCVNAHVRACVCSVKNDKMCGNKEMDENGSKESECVR